LAERHKDSAAGIAATRIEQAVARLLSKGRTLTADLGGTATTSEVTTAILSILKSI
jgi:isocitrate/isopropylmalate dehydrogenase